MSLLTDPVGTFKNGVTNQAKKIWATKDLAERMAFSRTTWIIHMMYCFGAVMIVDTFFVIAINDVFTLYKFYTIDVSWWILAIEEAYFNVHPMIEVVIIFFIVSPKIVTFSLKLSKKYSDKERAVFEWIEVKIKMKFPSYKTSAQRARERLDKPKKEGKIKKKFDAFMKTRNDVERLMIRACLWGIYIVVLGSFIFFMLSTTSTAFNSVLDPEQAELDEKELEEIKAEIDEILENQAPTRPDGMPPPTIFDILISKPDTVIP